MFHYCFQSLTSNGQTWDFRYNEPIQFLKAQLPQPQYKISFYQTVTPLKGCCYLETSFKNKLRLLLSCCFEGTEEPNIAPRQVSLRGLKCSFSGKLCAWYRSLRVALSSCLNSQQFCTGNLRKLTMIGGIQTHGLSYFYLIILNN